MEQTTTVARAAPSRFVTRRIGGEMIIVPVSAGVGDLESIYTLNDVGSRIWELLEEPLPVGRLQDVLVEEYDVSRDDAAGDVERFVEGLLVAGLVEIRDGRPA